MSKKHAVELVRDTFEAPFERGQFIRFVRELLNSFDDDSFAPRKGTYIPDSFREQVESLERVGVYEQDQKRIDILIVHLKKETSLERARTMQRNFVAGYLRGDYGSDNEKDAALVAFVSADPTDWRFSLVKLEYALEENEMGQLKGIEKFTPARRWSFLVGANEKSHTAQTQLVPILADEENNPSLDRLEKAFDIETVSDEFFDGYRQLFIETKLALDDVLLAEASLKSEFEAKQINSVDFAKKLLGQIVFLYYLQKKGWFGVPKGGVWGEGSKNFLRELFDGRHRSYQNFFNDILEPLFYQALRTDRSFQDHYDTHFQCKIPFLNGGLFDPIGDYDWVNSDLCLPNELFANEQEKNGDTGTGILDVFDRYNFTVREDEPFEKEVAIDPELLGKAYEKFNAIRPDNFEEYQAALSDGEKGSESQFNKKFGVYYTPREIVHYMCQQSLIQYLHTALNGQKVYRELGFGQQGMFGNEIKRGQLAMTAEDDLPEISLKDIEDLILRGERIKENDARVVAKGRETPDYKFEIPDSIRLYASRVDEALAAVKVCDPAVGSGAFPVGMMNEIVKARDVLRTYSPPVPQGHPPKYTLHGAQGPAEYLGGSTYDFKRACIENSLYGVDIDPGAVEIAKLRLWLSLIVDEEDPQNIKPLPNLDYKLMQGNSLLGLPDGALLNTEVLEKLEAKKKTYFDETHPTKKKEYRKKINALFESLVESVRLFDPTLSEINFDFRTHFSEIFQEKDGFDVVIGNPPYIGQSGNKEIFREVLHTSFGKKYHQRRMDYFYFFFHKGLEILAEGGVISYITTNYYFTATYADKLRAHLKRVSTIVNIIDFGNLKLFENAAGQHSAITTLRKKKSDIFKAKIAVTKRDGTSSGNILNSILYSKDQETLYEKISNSKLFDGDQNYIRLILSKKTDNYLLDAVLSKIQYGSLPLINVANIFQGIVTGANKASERQIKKHHLDAKKDDGIFIVDEEDVDFSKLNQLEKSFIKPWFKNSDIKKWYTSSETTEKLLYIRGDSDIYDDDIPNLIKHFEKFKPLLINRNVRTGSITVDDYDAFVKGRRDVPYVMIKSAFRSGKYYCVSYARSKEIFRSEKIVCPQFSRTNTFAFNDTEWFAASDVYFINKINKKYKLKYLLGILNSKLCYFWLFYKGQRKGDSLQLFKGPLSEIPIKLPDLKTEKEMISLVDEIMSLQGKSLRNIQALETQIDALVYELYGLTEEEIAVVEGRGE